MFFWIYFFNKALSPECVKIRNLKAKFMRISKKTHPYLHKDGKNCYEKENY